MKTGGILRAPATHDRQATASGLKGSWRHFIDDATAATACGTVAAVLRDSIQVAVRNGQDAAVWIRAVSRSAGESMKHSFRPGLICQCQLIDRAQSGAPAAICGAPNRFCPTSVTPASGFAPSPFKPVKL
jgi:hypothetical protein